jgi:hypothetical protein
MNVEQFKRFLELQGKRVIASESGYWHDAGSRVYLSIPYTRTIDPDPAELADLFRRHHILGLKYSTSDQSRGQPGAVYVIRDKAYDLHSQKRTVRVCVQKGLEHCTVRKIDFDYLLQHGLDLNRDTMARQHRDDPLFSDPTRWACLCRAGQQVEGAGAWGAFVGKHLAAYLICFIIDDCCHFLHEMSCTDLHEFHPNHVLMYKVAREMITRPNIGCVSSGLQPIFDIPGLDRFKRYIGFEKLEWNYIVVLHPALQAMLLSRPGWGLLDTARRRFPKQDALKRVHAIVNIARLSLGPCPKADMVQAVRDNE